MSRGTAAAAALFLLLRRHPSPASRLRFSLPFLSLSLFFLTRQQARVLVRVPGDGAPGGQRRHGRGSAPPPSPPSSGPSVFNASSGWGAYAPLLDETLGAFAAAAAVVKLSDCISW
jgi:hypothetical protein